MKKIRLNVADLDATEILSRDQLKAIFGGSTGSSDGSTEVYNFCDGKKSCTKNSDCSSSQYCTTSNGRSCCF